MIRPAMIDCSHPPRILQRLISGIARLAVDSRGISAVEFAMLLPLMMTLYLGTVEISQGVAIDRKVTLAARTIADLTSRAQSVTPSDLTDIFKAGEAIVAPYPTTTLTMKISQIYIDSTGKVTIPWSKASSGSGHGSTDAVSLPDALKINGTYLIWSEVSYLYKPTIGYVITGPMTLSDTMFMRARQGDKVDCSGC